jgi:hypothetical protein
MELYLNLRFKTYSRLRASLRLSVVKVFSFVRNLYTDGERPAKVGAIDKDRYPVTPAYVLGMACILYLHWRRQALILSVDREGIR